MVGFRLRPVGNLPVVKAKVGAGNPMEVTWKVVPAIPSRKVTELPLVMVGASFTVRIKFWLALGEMPLVAPKTKLYLPPLKAAALPESTPVAVLKVTPEGRVPVSL